jgi:hypothetical protein
VLNLALTTDKLQLVTSSTADIAVHGSFIDYVISPESATPGKQNTAIASAATTDVIAAPAASTYRNVKWLSMRNKHASTSNDVTVLFNANGTTYELLKCTLLPGEELVCREGVWFHFDSNGGVYGATVALADPRVIVRLLLAAHSNSTTTGTEVTDLKVANLGIGTYFMEYNLILRSSTSGTSILNGVNFTGTATMKIMSFINDAGGLATGTGSVDNSSVNPGQMVSGCTTGAFSTTAPNIGGADIAATATDLLTLITGVLRVTVAGNLEFWHSSETAVATTVEPGSNLVLTKVG